MARRLKKKRLKVKRNSVHGSPQQNKKASLALINMIDQRLKMLLQVVQGETVTTGAFSYSLADGANIQFVSEHDHVLMRIPVKLEWACDQVECGKYRCNGQKHIHIWPKSVEITIKNGQLDVSDRALTQQLSEQAKRAI